MAISLANLSESHKLSCDNFQQLIIRKVFNYEPITSSHQPIIAHTLDTRAKRQTKKKKNDLTLLKCYRANGIHVRPAPTCPPGQLTCASLCSTLLFECVNASRVDDTFCQHIIMSKVCGRRHFTEMQATPCPKPETRLANMAPKQWPTATAEIVFLCKFTRNRNQVNVAGNEAFGSAHGIWVLTE